MNRIVKPFAAAFAALTIFAVPAGAEVEPRIPSLNASGEGFVMVVPDIAIVTIGVTTRAETARAALDQNSAETARVIAAITGAGIEARDVQTSGLSVFPVYEERPPRADGEGGIVALPKIVGYQVQNEVRVTVREIGKSGALLDQVVSAGANQISGIYFDVSDPAAAADEALRKAIADARRKAELMAAAAGVRIVRILDISGGGSFPVFRAERAAFDAAAPSVPVMPGETRVSANANIIFEIAE
ncbi:MAG TPA: SIMPL domain-containing protein [Bauldia sp.]|nr:SIMPL domain-containing protein [Bauldia sp.]